MKRTFLAILACAIAAAAPRAQLFRFDFTPGSEALEGFVKVAPGDMYEDVRGYGYDLGGGTAESGDAPFFFSVKVPDGNYLVTATLGGESAGETTIRAESRRLFFDGVRTGVNGTAVCRFVVNKRDTIIPGGGRVRIKPRERAKLNWDDRLTLEFNGPSPRLLELEVERVGDVPTVFLCGNSTVVDQDNEPWASWGQVIPAFFTEGVCFANYAESGESADTFISAGRLAKALTQMKAGDWVFMEFGHNDEKQEGPGRGAFQSFLASLRTFVDEARAVGANPVLVTPTQRRSFGGDGRIRDTHGDFPEAMRWLSESEGVPLIDLCGMTRTLYEALGVEGSKRAFVHYPAGTYPGQDVDLEDDTHFNPYGACQVAKCVVEGMKALGLPLVRCLRPDFKDYDPANPDPVEDFRWSDSPFIEIVKPDGN